MANPYKHDIPRKWRSWDGVRILDFVTQTFQNTPCPPVELETLIDDMWEELDMREETRGTRFPDWDDNVPSYLS